MSDTMTRVQAICACRNIARLADELDRAPEDFRDGLKERANSMEMRLTDNTKYPYVTEKMDQALHNMWNGLRKWDREDEYFDDLFDDLESVEAEIADLDASGDSKPAKAPKGRESDTEADERAKRFSGQGAQSGRIPANKPNEANTPKEQPAEHEEAATPPVGVLTKADALRRKEAAVSFALEQIHEAPITVLDKKAIRNMAISDVLGMTKSDRTQQMIRAAYHIGVLRGIALLNSKLQNGDG